MFRSEIGGVKKPKQGFRLAGLALLGAIPVLMMAALVTGAFPLMIPCIHAALFGTMAWVYAHRSLRNAKFDRGALTFDGKTLRLDHRVLVERDDLRQAFTVPNEAGMLVRLERKSGGPLYVRVADRAEADALLHELGFDAEHTAAELRIASGVLAWPLAKQLTVLAGPIIGSVLLSTLFAGIFRSPVALFACVVAVMAYAFSMAFVPTNVRIGTDGIATSWFGTKRFIPHADIERAEAYSLFIGGKEQKGVHLFLKSGERVKLPTGQTDIGASEAARLVARIREAQTAGDRGAVATAATADLLERGNRPLVDWVRHLRGLGAGAATLRAPAVPKDVLLRIVEDSTAAPLARASAAVAALTDVTETDVRDRVRVAAQASASPKLRVALDRIADDAPTTDDAVAETLSTLESD